MCTSGKILATPLIRTQMVDRFVIPVGIQSRRIPYQSYSRSKHNISLYKSKKGFPLEQFLSAKSGVLG